MVCGRASRHPNGMPSEMADQTPLFALRITRLEQANEPPVFAWPRESASTEFSVALDTFDTRKGWGFLPARTALLETPHHDPHAEPEAALGWSQASIDGERGPDPPSTPLLNKICEAAVPRE
jgi:hypothetical protein